MRKDIYERIKVLKMDNIEPNFAKMLIRLTLRVISLLLNNNYLHFQPIKNYIKLLTITYSVGPPNRII